MSVCTFFGHSACYGLNVAVLRNAIEDFIKQGITEFLVGNHGQFDSMVFSCLQDLSKDYPEISYSVALAYLPAHKEEFDIYYGHSFYPEGQEIGPAKFAIERRNRYLIASADICICYVNYKYGGAYKFARLAKNAVCRFSTLAAGICSKKGRFWGIWGSLPLTKVRLDVYNVRSAYERLRPIKRGENDYAKTNPPNSFGSNGRHTGTQPLCLRGKK